jgi:hypothetical protein
MESVPFGKYLLVERLAQGGMAEVFRAVYQGAAGFEKQVAVKKILPIFDGAPEFVAMFADEARIASSLTHVNIAQVFDFGERDGSYFLAMELVDGVDLGRLRDATTRRGLRFPLPVAAFIIAEAARGLAYAHDKRGRDGAALGIVHRDISPPNILCSYAGEVKIADFGIAKAIGKMHKTESGTVMGKIRYMSPEQVSGEPLDGRSDIFALAAILWELCAAGPLWSGDNPGAVADQVKNARVEPPSRRARDVPSELDRICMKALERGRDARYARAADLARDLAAWLAAAAPSLGREDVGSFMQEVVPRADAEGDEATRTSRAIGMAATVPSGNLLAEVAPSGITAPSVPVEPPAGERASAATQLGRVAHTTSRSRGSLAVAVTAVVLLGSGALGYRLRHWLVPETLPPPTHADAAPASSVDAAPSRAQLSDADKLRLQAALESLPQAEATWRGVQADDYLTVLSAVDAAVCLTPHGTVEPVLPSLLRTRVEAARLLSETQAVFHYLDLAGELPPRVASSLQAFLRTHSVYTFGATGWQLAHLAALSQPAAAPLRLAVITQNGALGQWRKDGPSADPSLPYPELCERQTAVKRFATLAPGSTAADAFARYLAAVPPELPADVDGLRYIITGAELDDAAAQLLVHLRVTNGSVDDKPLALDQLRLAGFVKAPEVDPPAARLGPSLTREVRLTFGGVTDQLTSAAVLVIPHARVELQAYSRDLR